MKSVSPIAQWKLSCWLLQVGASGNYNRVTTDPNRVQMPDWRLFQLGRLLNHAAKPPHH
ncbi:hypothetical protein OK016_12835 [Vibrio chagasii]|nr:hypothetical protein [Vibrio chagasii]